MKYLLVILLLAGCALPRKANLQERVKIKNIISQAREKLNSGDLVSAESLINLANEINPNDEVVLDAYGCLFWRKNQNVIAENYFRNSILINPKFENAYLNLAFILERKGSIEEAKNLLLYVLKLNPLNYRARNNYAALLTNKDLAREEFSKALLAAPKVDFVLEYNKSQYSQHTLNFLPSVSQ